MSDKSEIQPNEDQRGATVTYVTPHAADETSAPGPYKGLSADRPPVSTTKPDVPVAQTLAAGAGAHTPPDDEAAQLERNAMKRDGNQIVPTAAPVVKASKS